MTSSLRRTDILALSNLRNDGRKPEEIRRMRIQMGPLAIATTAGVGGSALVEMGLTVALATVRGPVECTRRSDELPDRYVFVSRSSSESECQARCTRSRLCDT